MSDIAAPVAPPAPASTALQATLRAFNTNKASWIGLAIFLIVVARRDPRARSSPRMIRSIRTFSTG